MKRPAVASGAKDQVARLLTLVPYLHAHGQVRLDEAAAALGSTPEQLVKDLKVLFMCGLPGGYPDDLIDVDLDALEDPEDGELRRRRDPGLQRRLPRPAAAADPDRGHRGHRRAAGAARRRRRRHPRGRRPDPGQARGRRGASTTGGPALIDPGDDDDAAIVRLRASLEDAVARGRQVRLTYYVPTRDEESERVVDPRGVVTSAGAAYLDAWCHSAEAPRLFRLDRIDEAEVLDSPVETAPERPRDLADGLFQRVPGDHPGHAATGAGGPLGGRVLPGRGGAVPAGAASSRSTCSSPTSAG